MTLLFVVISTNIFAQDKTITISGMPSNAPYCYTNSEGELDGYVPNVAKIIMEESGLSYTMSKTTRNFMYYYEGTSAIDNSLESKNLYYSILNA